MTSSRRLRAADVQQASAATACADRWVKSAPTAATPPCRAFSPSSRRASSIGRAETTAISSASPQSPGSNASLTAGDGRMLSVVQPDRIRTHRQLDRRSSGSTNCHSLVQQSRARRREHDCRIQPQRRRVPASTGGSNGFTTCPFVPTPTTTFCRSTRPLPAVGSRDRPAPDPRCPGPPRRRPVRRRLRCPGPMAARDNPPVAGRPRAQGTSRSERRFLRSDPRKSQGRMADRRPVTARHLKFDRVSEDVSPAGVLQCGCVPGAWLHTALHRRGSSLSWSRLHAGWW